MGRESCEPSEKKKGYEKGGGGAREEEIEISLINFDGSKSEKRGVVKKEVETYSCDWGNV